MGQLKLGGGTGAVAASAHASCARFRGTDPMVTGQSRRSIAKAVGSPDTNGGIPLARWVRAQTFERLIRDEVFASQIATKSAGALKLPRPTSVSVVNATEDVSKTRDHLKSAVEIAIKQGAATLVIAPAVPYPGFNDQDATEVLPDFVVICNSADDGAAYLIAGDAKDYERVRSKIDDARMLKGFIQVAFGAEAFDQWPDLPADLKVHKFGVLAVPRNAFLQPTIVSEDLTDHREEVRIRLEERIAEAELITWSGDAKSFVSHLEATFDPASCTTCPLFSYCRNELRTTDDPLSFLVEIGIPRNRRSVLLPVVLNPETQPNKVPQALIARVRASKMGVPSLTGQRRIDPLGAEGTINVVLVKSDGSALGIHGLGIRPAGRDSWNFHTFEQPQSDVTRRSVMQILGSAIEDALLPVEDGHSSPRPVQIIVPDTNTGDLLASIADSLAGVEITRLRWVRDLEMGRPPLTFDGLPATVPPALDTNARVAVSFFLEEDRARAFATRSAVFDARSAVARLIVAGGPPSNSGRLDYLTGWLEALDTGPLNTRIFADSIEMSKDTPGARLSNKRSDELNELLYKLGEKESGAKSYKSLVLETLEYRADVLDRAIRSIQRFAISNLREAYFALEADAQVVWRRRLDLQANDLVRFARTSEFWRNKLVPIVEADAKCAKLLALLSNPDTASDSATDAGVRATATAVVESINPTVLKVDSRNFTSGMVVVLLHLNGVAEVEDADVTVKVQKGSFAITGLSAGELIAHLDGEAGHFHWAPKKSASLSPGDVVVIADAESSDWFQTAYSHKNVNVNRPKLDEENAPKPDCSYEAYLGDPEKHKYCCRPHAVREAETSDWLAEKRVAGELNPEIWPPLQDADSFDISAHGEPISEAVTDVDRATPEYLTMDEFE